MADVLSPYVQRRLTSLFGTPLDPVVRHARCPQRRGAVMPTTVPVTAFRERADRLGAPAARALAARRRQSQLPPQPPGQQTQQRRRQRYQDYDTSPQKGRGARMRRRPASSQDRCEEVLVVRAPGVSLHTLLRQLHAWYCPFPAMYLGGSGGGGSGGGGGGGDNDAASPQFPAVRQDCYAPSALLLREALFVDPQVSSVLDEFVSTILRLTGDNAAIPAGGSNNTMRNSGTGRVGSVGGSGSGGVNYSDAHFGEAQYVELSVKLYRCLVNDRLPTSSSQLRRVVRQDWGADSLGRASLTPGHLKRLLFQLADGWTSRVSASAYSSFLRRVMSAILVVSKGDRGGEGGRRGYGNRFGSRSGSRSGSRGSNRSSSRSGSCGSNHGSAQAKSQSGGAAAAATATATATATSSADTVTTYAWREDGGIRHYDPLQLAHTARKIRFWDCKVDPPATPTTPDLVTTDAAQPETNPAPCRPSATGVEPLPAFSAPRAASHKPTTPSSYLRLKVGLPSTPSELVPSPPRVSMGEDKPPPATISDGATVPDDATAKRLGTQKPKPKSPHQFRSARIAAQRAEMERERVQRERNRHGYVEVVEQPSSSAMTVHRLHRPLRGKPPARTVPLRLVEPPRAARAVAERPPQSPGIRFVPQQNSNAVSSSTGDITSPLPAHWIHDPHSDATYEGDDADNVGVDVDIDMSVSPADPRSPPRLRLDLGHEKTPTELRYMCYSLGLAPDASQVHQLAGVHRSRHFEVELGHSAGWQTRTRMTELAVAQSSPRNKISWGIER